jgi:putative membrane-bound dehydrogenase-like protein
MTRAIALPVLLSLLALSLPAQAADEADAEGFVSIFDGKSLDGWDGNPKFWSVRDGAITGQTTAENPTQGNTFIVWRKGEIGDFELRLKFRIVGGNSGIQYRSKEVEKWVIAGYQADFDGAGQWTGTLYEERARGILAKRGNKVEITAEGEKKEVGQTTPESEILAAYKKEDWNDYTVTARGNHLVQKVNGLVTVDVTDNQKDKAATSGLLALQLHAGPPMTVQFKEIRLKRLDKASNDQGAAAAGSEKKKVVFVAGRASHGYGSHEHYAGCVLLAKELERAMPNFEVEVVRDGWPQDASVLSGADCIVMYADGGGGHPVNPHLEEMDKLAKKGVGVVCIHYAVEVPKGPSGDAFLDWIGGYFETNWSVNPHWTANFKSFPEHPITRGVEPFSINDEWYYHMRFREGMKGVTPILTDLPPKETLNRPDGPHSGNPDVRKAVASGEPQHVAWAAEREDGGRGFGFTGGHVHWNWGDPNFRKVMLNAITWCAKADVPEEGVEAKPLPVAALEQNQDEPKPENFNSDEIRTRLKLPADGETGAAPEKKTTERSRNVKPAFQSDVVTTQTPGHAVNVEVDLAGAKSLYLVVTDGDNGFGCDWADWAEPRLVAADGSEKRLTEVRWNYAGTDWGQIRVNANAEGRPLRIAGKAVEYGIGAHANSLIVYDLPPGFVKFRARAGLDNGGTDQGGGQATSVRFAVYTQKPPQSALRGSQSSGSSNGSREPQDAVAGLDIADGLEATLFAAEPNILSLTNLDVDARGRVWVCEVMNYRLHNGKRPEGDRILILEDTDGDGRSDNTKVYYQGRDIDSAMGICVLGNQVIVSATPNIWVFTDENGDDKPDHKEALFTKTGAPQHDHSAHSFLFGPDGKYYWNFGNTGQAVHDKNGAPVVDLMGNRVVDNGKPYFGGMVFRCDRDGSNFEVLGHNFRNNYEVTVDSFGTLWQSDNDDDGNRGVRINYVMEYGNFGYRDEMTGAGWQTPRTNMEAEIPLRHWHLNDPGVVPNLVQTGAGSPTGITVNEGDFLPSVFRNQVIHCDAGPNIVRAYPVENDGAGYEGEMENIAHGARDNWFRPADACIAPDGSLFVTDWYDPGVGGHNMQDLERGRLFRIAPPNTGYKVPKFDFHSIEGAIAALKNPNYAVRYLAWTRLHEAGEQAEPALAKMFESDDNPRYRARALWLLGKMPGKGEQYVGKAIKDNDADIRIVGIRLARQLQLDVAPIVAALVEDPSPQVRRDCAVALHENDSAKTPELWAALASRHDGKDRWYLEALGIAATGQWDACLDAWLKKVGDWNTPAGRDVVWRSRAKKTPELLAKIIGHPSTTLEQLPRYFRAFDFQTGPEKQIALSLLAVSKHAGDAERQAFITRETLERLQEVDLAAQPELAKAVEAAVQSARGTNDFVNLVAQFRLEKYFPELLALAQRHPGEQIGVEAIRALLGVDQFALIGSGLTGKDVVAALNVAAALGNSADGRIVGLLLPIVQDSSRDLELRREATRGMAKTRNGAERLIALARSGELDEALKPAASFPLNSAPWEDIRDQAAKLFPLPPPRNNEPLPPLNQLLAMPGSVERGREVFAKAGECAKCHVVNGEGKEVGPNLSEIGGKLSKPAIFESILYPSAGIAHSYETYSAVTGDGNVITGLLVSQTAEAVTIKKEDGLTITLKPSDLEELVKQKVSLMPADLQKTMTTQELVDVVEYLTTLKKP